MPRPRNVVETPRKDRPRKSPNPPGRPRSAGPVGAYAHARRRLTDERRELERLRKEAEGVARPPLESDIGYLAVRRDAEEAAERAAAERRVRPPPLRREPSYRICLKLRPYHSWRGRLTVPPQPL
jgi:hypothetical protein